jgi:hypothetical protein
MPARLAESPWRFSRTAHRATAAPSRRDTVTSRAPGGQRSGRVRTGTSAATAARRAPRSVRQGRWSGSSSVHGGVSLKLP